MHSQSIVLTLRHILDNIPIVRHSKYPGMTLATRTIYFSRSYVTNLGADSHVNNSLPTCTRGNKWFTRGLRCKINRRRSFAYWLRLVQTVPAVSSAGKRGSTKDRSKLIGVETLLVCPSQLSVWVLLARKLTRDCSQTNRKIRCLLCTTSVTCWLASVNFIERSTRVTPILAALIYIRRNIKHTSMKLP